MKIKMNVPKTIWKEKLFFGLRNEDYTRIYLSAPSWDCDWYWGFGYLGNKNAHYHLSSYANQTKCITDSEGKFSVFTEKRNKNMYDCLLEDYTLNPRIRSNLWTFCELSQTAYALKESAEVLQRGGSHYSTNPVKEIIKNPEEVSRINNVVLPAIFDHVYSLLKQI